MENINILGIEEAQTKTGKAYLRLAVEGDTKAWTCFDREVFAKLKLGSNVVTVKRNGYTTIIAAHDAVLNDHTVSKTIKIAAQGMDNAVFMQPKNDMLYCNYINNVVLVYNDLTQRVAQAKWEDMSFQERFDLVKLAEAVVNYARSAY